MKINTAKGVLTRLFGLSNCEFCDQNIIIAKNLLVKTIIPRHYLLLVHKLISNVNRKITFRRLRDISHNPQQVQAPPMFLT